MICGWPDVEIYAAVSAYAKHKQLKNCYGGPNMAEAMIELLRDSGVGQRADSIAWTSASALSAGSWFGRRPLSGSRVLKSHVNVRHFESFTLNAVPHQEFKGEAGIP